MQQQYSIRYASRSTRVVHWTDSQAKPDVVLLQRTGEHDIIGGQKILAADNSLVLEDFDKEEVGVFVVRVVNSDWTTDLCTQWIVDSRLRRTGHLGLQHFPESFAFG